VHERKFGSSPNADWVFSELSGVPVGEKDAPQGIQLTRASPPFPPNRVRGSDEFHKGDIVVAVNGYRAAGAEWPERVFSDVAGDGLAVVELIRMGESMVIALRWPSTGAPPSGGGP
jgi:hypothetical protein